MPENNSDILTPLEPIELELESFTPLPHHLVGLTANQWPRSVIDAYYVTVGSGEWVGISGFDSEYEVLELIAKMRIRVRREYGKRLNAKTVRRPGPVWAIAFRVVEVRPL